MITLTNDIEAIAHITRLSSGFYTTITFTSDWDADRVVSDLKLDLPQYDIQLEYIEHELPF